MINLTEQERRYFAEYLLQEANSDEGLAKQMDQMPSPPTQELAKRYRMHAAAARLTARKLLHTETVTHQGHSA